MYGGQFCRVVIDSDEDVGGTWIKVSTGREEGPHAKTFMLNEAVEPNDGQYQRNT